MSTPKASDENIPPFMVPSAYLVLPRTGQLGSRGNHQEVP